MKKILLLCSLIFLSNTAWADEQKPDYNFNLGLNFYDNQELKFIPFQSNPYRNYEYYRFDEYETDLYNRKRSFYPSLKTKKEQKLEQQLQKKLMKKKLLRQVQRFAQDELPIIVYNGGLVAGYLVNQTYKFFDSEARASATISGIKFTFKKGNDGPLRFEMKKKLDFGEAQFKTSRENSESTVFIQWKLNF